MNSEQQGVARLLFKNRILEASGTVFEEIFTKLMTYSEPGFRQIKPQGRVGDRKNDGYIQKRGAFFQVHAPEDPASAPAVTKAIKKAKADFQGLLAYWGNICRVREYFFVYNDKYHGSFPEIEETLADLKTTYHLDHCAPVLAKDLEDRLFRLRDDEMVGIIGFVPSLEPIDLLDYGLLTDVIQHVLNHFRPISEEDLVAPDFDEKAEYNMLSRQVKTILDSAFFQVGEIDGYFDRNSEYTRQAVRDRMKQMYMAAVEQHKMANQPQKGDMIFWHIVDNLRPPSPQTTGPDTKRIQDAIFVLVAYYFHSCDVFENPPV
jgi:hypothetical protein